MHVSSKRPGHADEPRLSTNRDPSPYTGAMTEAGSPVKSTISVKDIADGIARSWQQHAGITVQMLTDTAIYLVERKLVEWVVEDAASAATSTDVFRQIRKLGIDVAIVLPMPELGRAHEELWGTGLVLYGWIDRGDNVIRFTEPEVA